MFDIKIFTYIDNNESVIYNNHLKCTLDDLSDTILNDLKVMWKDISSALRVLPRTQTIYLAVGYNEMYYKVEVPYSYYGTKSDEQVSSFWRAISIMTDGKSKNKFDNNAQTLIDFKINYILACMGAFVEDEWEDYLVAAVKRGSLDYERLMGLCKTERVTKAWLHNFVYYKGKYNEYKLSKYIEDDKLDKYIEYALENELYDTIGFFYNEYPNKYTIESLASLLNEDMAGGLNVTDIIASKLTPDDFAYLIKSEIVSSTVIDRIGKQVSIDMLVKTANIVGYENLTGSLHNRLKVLNYG